MLLVQGSVSVTAYNPNNRFEIKIWEEDFREIPTRMLCARICQSIGDGPFPVLLDLHGGAWTSKDRMANVAMADAMAQSGILTVSIDLRLASEAPYPASVQDANYGIRWLKMKAPSWQGEPSTLGLLGSSSGGHVAELLGMRPEDPRYNALPLEGHEEIDASVRYVATRSPILWRATTTRSSRDVKRWRAATTFISIHLVILRKLILSEYLSAESRSSCRNC